jgi:hypothetical protein
MVLTPEGITVTCTQGPKGSMIDYSIIDGPMHHIIKAKPLYEIPVKTHIGIEYSIDINPKQIKTLQLIKPKEIITTEGDLALEP